MPLYRFTINTGGIIDEVKLHLPSDGAAIREAKKAFAEAAFEELMTTANLGRGDVAMAMRVQAATGIIFDATLTFACGPVGD